jgi:hypothetical protein
MEELYIEGLATHDGPESCVGSREGVGEALTGVHAGRVLSREIVPIGVPTLSKQAEGHIGGRVIASCRRTLRGQRPRACMESPRARTGRSQACPSGRIAGRAAQGRPRPHA